MEKAAFAARWFRSISLLAFFLASPAFSGELSLLVNGTAKHINPPPGTNYNETNWGAGLQYDFARGDSPWAPFLTASEFRDSFDRPSSYAGGGFMRRWEISPQFGGLHADAGLVMFLMKREDFRHDKPFFGALPAFNVGTQRVSVNITYVPKVQPKMTQLFFFQLKLGIMEF